jgi:dolichyl-phosphate beta-glucosyltransferase
MTSSADAGDLLLVIPCFRESRRFPAYLRSLVKDLDDAPHLRVALLMVDDGSGPAEQKALSQIINEAHKLARRTTILEPIYLPENHGKGAAIREGWSRAGSQAWLGFVDADGAIPSREVVRVCTRAFAKPHDYDALIASRVRMLGRQVERPVIRHVAARLFATVVGELLIPHVYDSQCGFKLVRRDAYARIAGLLTENRFAFDVELLAALLTSGARIREVPIDWKHIPGSKVSLLRDGAQMTAAVRRICLRRKSWLENLG